MKKSILLSLIVSFSALGQDINYIPIGGQTTGGGSGSATNVLTIDSRVLSFITNCSLTGAEQKDIIDFYTDLNAANIWTNLVDMVPLQNRWGTNMVTLFGRNCASTNYRDVAGVWFTNNTPLVVSNLTPVTSNTLVYIYHVPLYLDINSGSLRPNEFGGINWTIGLCSSNASDADFIFQSDSKPYVATRNPTATSHTSGNGSGIIWGWQREKFDWQTTGNQEVFAGNRTIHGMTDDGQGGFGLFRDTVLTPIGYTNGNWMGFSLNFGLPHSNALVNLNIGADQTNSSFLKSQVIIHDALVFNCALNSNQWPAVVRACRRLEKSATDRVLISDSREALGYSSNASDNAWPFTNEPSYFYKMGLTADEQVTFYNYSIGGHSWLYFLGQATNWLYLDQKFVPAGKVITKEADVELGINDFFSNFYASWFIWTNYTLPLVNFAQSNSVKLVLATVRQTGTNGAVYPIQSGQSYEVERLKFNQIIVSNSFYFARTPRQDLVYDPFYLNNTNTTPDGTHPNTTNATPLNMALADIWAGNHPAISSHWNTWFVVNDGNSPSANPLLFTNRFAYPIMIQVSGGIVTNLTQRSYEATNTLYSSTTGPLTGYQEIALPVNAVISIGYTNTAPTVNWKYQPGAVP